MIASYLIDTELTQQTLEKLAANFLGDFVIRRKGDIKKK
jgi:hypothetical protein